MAFYSGYYVLLCLIVAGSMHGMELDFFALVRESNLERLKELYEQNQNPMLFAACKDAEDNSLLHLVSNAKMALFLLSSKVPIKAVNKLQNTPLHTIVWDKTDIEFDCAAALLDYGAELTALNHNKQNPVHLIAAKSPEFIQKLVTHVPRHAIYAQMKPERVKMLYTALLTFKKFEGSLSCSIPREIKRIICEYCVLPPYQSAQEHELVNALLFKHLDILSNALSAQDNLNHTPGSLEQRYSTLDKSKLLDPMRLHQFVPDIIASIGRLVTLKLSYKVQANILTSVLLPSTEPQVRVLDPE